jgi:peptidoglycan/xylan/chitin deacetylase (PgdA/CDA1 family)
MEIALAPPRYRDLSWIEAARRRASSRLSRYFARTPHRLDNARPLVSFTFDDAAASAHTLGAPLLERAGARGVFYIATGLVGRRTTDYAMLDRSAVRDLHRRGHEIGLHGHHHSAVGWLGRDALREEIHRNQGELAEIDAGIAARNFAYPFGIVSVERKRALAEITSSSRSIAPGVNPRRFDSQYLRSVELADARLTPRRLADWLETARRSRGWLVFTLHDISPSPSPFGCTPGLLKAAILGAVSRGFEIVTVAQALAQSQLAPGKNDNRTF